jgi:hypothetical protein
MTRLANVLTPIELAQDDGIDGKAATVLTSVAGLVAAGTQFLPLKDAKDIIHVKNTYGGILNITVKAGVGPRRGIGDLVVPVAATSGEQIIGPLESSRFKQADGYVYIDFDAAFTGLIGVYRLPG